VGRGVRGTRRGRVRRGSDRRRGRSRELRGASNSLERAGICAISGLWLWYCRCRHPCDPFG